jgi:hypothetical protein
MVGGGELLLMLRGQAKWRILGQMLNRCNGLKPNINYNKTHGARH